MSQRKKSESPLTERKIMSKKNENSVNESKSKFYSFCYKKNKSNDVRILK